ncbi:MAG: creatininase family protein [Nitrospiraceae bacterium]|nr:creatininase family protein [Nitrospiraceae bacterium]
MMWQSATSPLIQQLDRAIPVLLPIAATEQHGPHLPCGTDRLIVEYFCELLERELTNSVLILPVIAVGCSSHHMDFAGTLTVSHETFIDYVTEILESVARQGFRKIVIFNSHGGNRGVGQVILERFGHAHPDCSVVFATWWHIAGDELSRITETGPGGVGHACEFETSLVDLIAPDLIRRDLIKAGEHVDTFEWAAADMLRGPKAGLYRSMKQLTTNGVYGDPTKASPAKGTAIANAVLAALRKIILDLQRA